MNLEVLPHDFCKLKIPNLYKNVRNFYCDKEYCLLHKKTCLLLLLNIFGKHNLNRSDPMEIVAKNRVTEKFNEK